MSRNYWPNALKFATLVAFVSVAAQARASAGRNTPEQAAKPYVVLVSFDGFRHDYLDRYKLPNFQRVASQGMRADALTPEYPSTTFPNHYSIVTGLYPEHHGIVGMDFFDPARREDFDYRTPTALDGSWYRGEPIWATAEKQGMATGTAYWVGSEAEISGMRPSYWKKFAEHLSNDALVDAMLGWLALPDSARPHFLAAYFHDVDAAGHRFGPDSQEVQAAAESVDRTFGRLLDGLEKLPFRDRVYVVLVSDHGMATATGHDLPLESVLDTSAIRGHGSGSMVNLYPQGGPAEARALRDAINAKLQHGRAYLREEVPIALHYRADPRIGAVVIIMDEPWRLAPRPHDGRDMRSMAGWHGWDPASPDMGGLFLAMGPGVRKGTRIPAFQNVEIYPLLTEWLGLKPASGIDGRPGWLRTQIENATPGPAR